MNYKELEDNLKLMNKLKKTGLCCQLIGPKGDIGPTGPKGEVGPTGPIAESVYQGIFFTGFSDTDTSKLMELLDSWIVHNNYFRVLNETDIEIDPGLYEITFSGIVEEADENSGASFYLLNEDGAIKDLTFELLRGNGSQMNFSQSILFRFDKITTLHVEANIDGTAKVSGVNLIMKKINEN